MGRVQTMNLKAYSRNFVRQPHRNGSWDSICARCCQIAAKESREDELGIHEAAHVCDSWLNYALQMIPGLLDRFHVEASPEMPTHEQERLSILHSVKNAIVARTNCH